MTSYELLSQEQSQIQPVTRQAGCPGREGKLYGGLYQLTHCLRSKLSSGRSPPLGDGGDNVSESQDRAGLGFSELRFDDRISQTGFPG